MSMSKKLSGLMAAAKRAFSICEEEEESPYAKTYVLEYTKSNGVKFEEHWALTPDVYEEAQQWHARQKEGATAEGLSRWLYGHGGKFHRAGGLPSYIITRPDGSLIEEYWEDGKPKKRPVYTDITKIPGVKDTTPWP